MNRLLPPLCLLLAIALLIAGFALWAVEAPQASAELAHARATGDDQYGDALEAQLKRRQLARLVLLGCLFAGSGIMVVAAFLVMRPAD